MDTDDPRPDPAHADVLPPGNPGPPPNRPSPTPFEGFVAGGPVTFGRMTAVAVLRAHADDLRRRAAAVDLLVARVQSGGTMTPAEDQALWALFIDTVAKG